MKPALAAESVAYLADLLPESALERAIAYGVDPTLTIFNRYGLMPEERLARASATIRSAANFAQSQADKP